MQFKNTNYSIFFISSIFQRISVLCAFFTSLLSSLTLLGQHVLVYYILIELKKLQLFLRLSSLRLLKKLAWTRCTCPLYPDRTKETTSLLSPIILQIAQEAWTRYTYTIIILKKEDKIPSLKQTGFHHSFHKVDKFPSFLSSADFRGKKWTSVHHYRGQVSIISKSGQLAIIKWTTFLAPAGFFKKV